MTDKEKIKTFLKALSKDDYQKANEIFPEVVKSSVKTLINKNRQDVINDINTKASELISSSVLEKEEKKEETTAEEK